MKIKTVTITNFRGIQGPMEIHPEHLNVFIGKCGSGKSSIMQAIRFALTGNSKAEYIRNGEKNMKVELVFEDGSAIERIRTKTSTTVKCNGKKTTSKSLNEFIIDKLGASAEIYEAMCGVDYFDSISQKDLSSLFLSLLPVQMSFDSMCDIIGRLPFEYSVEFSEENRAFLEKEFVQYRKPFGLKEIAASYKNFYDRRRELKVLVEHLESRALFDESTLPEEKKGDLEAKLYDIAKKETAFQNYQKQLSAYEKSVKAREEALKRLDALKVSLKEYDGIKRPEKDVIEKAEDHKERFERATRQSSDTISTLNSNLALFQKTLDSLGKPVCPISDKLVCTTDKTGLKDELNAMIQKNRATIEEHQTFIQQCKLQIEKRIDIIKAYNQQELLFTKKEALEKQIREFVLPELLEKPEENVQTDYSEQKQEIRQKQQILAAFENAKKAKEELTEKRSELKKLEFAVRALDNKTGVPNEVLFVTMKKMEEMCKEKIERLGRYFRMEFSCDEGIHIMVETKPNMGLVPMDGVSTGEFVIVAYLLMSVVNKIMDTKYLLIDSLDKLDAEYTKQFLTLLDNDDTFEHIFIGAVNHPDTVALIPPTNHVTMLP